VLDTATSSTLGRVAQVRVGVAAVVEDGGRWLVLRRRGSHGAGTWGLPGGHQEVGESPEQTAVRETAEETGLTVVATARLGFTDDPMPEEDRHYVTLFVACSPVAGHARVVEPDKADELAWRTPVELREHPEELFAPLRRFLLEFPEHAPADGGAWDDRGVEDDGIERRVRKLAVEHAETRWLALRLDDDVKEIRSDLRAVRHVQGEHTRRFDRVDAEIDTMKGVLSEHTARFESVDGQLRSLTQLIGQVLDRLPEDPGPGT
jgi:8-oxo-dGTP diphosphatase